MSRFSPLHNMLAALAVLVLLAGCESLGEAASDSGIVDALSPDPSIKPDRDRRAIETERDGGGDGGGY